MSENMYQRIKRLRKSQGLSQQELAERIGFADRSSVSRIEHGEFDLKANIIGNIAKVLDVSPSYLMDGEEKEHPQPNATPSPYLNAPLFASVSAGFGTSRDEAIGTYPCVVSSEDEAYNTLCVIVEGDSMSPKIENGDIIQVRRQSSVDSGDIAVVQLDRQDFYVKKVEYGADYIRLVSLNANYPPIILKGAEVLRCDVKGKVKRVTRDI